MNDWKFACILMTFAFIGVTLVFLFTWIKMLVHMKDARESHETMTTAIGFIWAHCDKGAMRLMVDYLEKKVGLDMSEERQWVERFKSYQPPNYVPFDDKVVAWIVVDRDSQNVWGMLSSSMPNGMERVSSAFVDVSKLASELWKGRIEPFVYSSREDAEKAAKVASDHVNRYLHRPEVAATMTSEQLLAATKYPEVVGITQSNVDFIMRNVAKGSESLLAKKAAEDGKAAEKAGSPAPQSPEASWNIG